MLIMTLLGATGDRIAYQAPPWAPSTLRPPTERLLLAHLPTPLHRWPLPRVDPKKTQVFIKRDDCTGCELSGNKVRKLEFLLADAVSKGCDAVITVGGIQSNHCRATAAAARRVGLTPHIVLNAGDDVEAYRKSLVGNLLVDRLVGARMHLVDGATFESKGGWQLACQLKERLAEEESSQAYAFPSGGSNALGTWGYLQAVREIEQQLAGAAEELGGPIDRVYFGCGSGGTAAGLALGLHYSSLQCELVGLGVDDSPDFFYEKLDRLMTECHVVADDAAPPFDLKARDLLRIEDCVGLGYAQATAEELSYACEVARTTGVVMDPVYTGKALLGMARDLQKNPVGRALFIHTGGLLGVFAKVDQLAALPELWAENDV